MHSFQTGIFIKDYAMRGDRSFLKIIHEFIKNFLCLLIVSHANKLKIIQISLLRYP